ncbi:DUF2188 domain-containing protein [Aneurinibacillus tyrosinisolvens]|uniref:DUF2188 domain-containing protein n=1 Tax=Aneurinibacillus tyrosinisolvens TaxID=1443435 RepID=UPI00063FBF23|nr:DUF2188 domain-containing protein [Aneurinibacillus tyrosinisolvens]
MFGLSDVMKFLTAFFVVLPVVTLLHEAGHVFFAKVLGGKNIKVVLGSGDVVCKIGALEIREYYFWYGICHYERLRYNNRFTNILVYSGGIVFNSISALAVELLVRHHVLANETLYYQFVYFSFYFVFFAVFPMGYPDGSYSDGKVILNLLRNRSSGERETVYIVAKDEAHNQWIFKKKHGRDTIDVCSQKGKAIHLAEDMAEKNKPSRLLIYSRQGKVEEERIYTALPQ